MGNKSKRGIKSEAGITYIDIERILESRVPSLSKKLPKFVISLLRKIICEDELNEIIDQYGHQSGLDFAKSMLVDHFHININVEGEENLPDDSHLIFVSNHPLGGIDGIALISVLGKKYKQLKVPVNDFLMYAENMKDYFIPINKIGGKQTKGTSLLINETCESDAAILFFPAGMCSRRQPNGEIEDNNWKKTFISKAKTYKRDIVPIYFDGYNSNFFYNLAYYRSKLGIKANIEMAFLVNEFTNKSGQTFTIKIAPPIPYTSFNESKSDSEWAADIKQLVYSLK